MHAYCLILHTYIRAYLLSESTYIHMVHAYCLILHTYIHARLLSDSTYIHTVHAYCLILRTYIRARLLSDSDAVTSWKRHFLSGWRQREGQWLLGLGREG